MNEGKYFTEVSLIHPEVILLSGGGNDLVGGGKVAFMVRTKPDKEFFNVEYIRDLKDKDLSKSERDMLYDGLEYLSKDFFAFLWAFELQYKYIIKQLRKKFPDTKIITQGYDYGIPTFKRSLPLKKLLFNILMNNGHWLKQPLMLRRIPEDKQPKILFAMIYLFNEMLIKICYSPALGSKVFHIDCRGTAQKPSDWFDEMHLKAKGFKKVAQKFCECIEREDEEIKVFKVKDLHKN